MQNQRYSRDEFLEMFKQDVIRLSKYIPWLEDKSGDDVSKNYQDGNKMDHTLTFPVYDSILLAFLNDASTTVFMEKNYQYFYTKNHIHDYQDELAMIERADIMHMDTLQCILSRYVFGGMVKAYLWKAGVDHKIFVTVLKKARQIVEFWSEPLVIEDEIPAEGYPEEFTYPEVDEADWTDEEFAAVLSGELNADDIPRLRWEKEHAAENAEASEAAAGAENSVKEIVLPADFVFPEVDDADWTDEEFAAVLAGELNPDDIPRMHYEKENGVKVIFGNADAGIEQGAEPVENDITGGSADEDTTGNIDETIENNTENNTVREEVLPADFVFPEVDDTDWTDEEFAAVLAGELDSNDIPRMHYEKEHGVKVVFEEPGIEAEGTDEIEVEDETDTVDGIESEMDEKPVVEAETESETAVEAEPETVEESEQEQTESIEEIKSEAASEEIAEPEASSELAEESEKETGSEAEANSDIATESAQTVETEPEPIETQESETVPEQQEKSDTNPEQESITESEPDEEPVNESESIEVSETTPEQAAEAPETDSNEETGALE